MNRGIVVSSVTVRFGGVTALSDVSLNVQPRDIVGVIGPNGSGKSTLFNAVSGLVRPASGEIRIDGQDAVGVPPETLVRQGLARTFQTPRVDPVLPVEAAILCGFQTKARQSLLGAMLHLPGQRREEAQMRASCRAIMERLGLIEVADVPLGELPMGQVRLVDVARAMASEPRYLLLDEPAAGLSLLEQRRLAAAIRLLAADGVGVLLVEHNFGLVGELCRHVTVLDRGKVLLEGDVATVRSNPVFLQTYLGSHAA
ncbi:ABC transporter ATP-binding protein [Microvirga pudoricolor]|uniref:ABC transporter ATP-binding protein n=1 Tax=Microvirga pudoricolor TaxID=2778729 RepID=UPI001951A4EA|nr:ATP-binding cassette domain-containing protein [Microvirga pudoricolor]MBM6594865.1 ABC transporter ATP-binding protein [Microvirga pudoricolor]